MGAFCKLIVKGASRVFFLISRCLSNHTCVFVVHTFLNTHRNTTTHVVQHVLTFVFLHWDYVTLKVRAKVTEGLMLSLPLSHFHASTSAAALLLRAALCPYNWCDFFFFKSQLFLSKHTNKQFPVCKSLGVMIVCFHLDFESIVSHNVLYLRFLRAEMSHFLTLLFLPSSQKGRPFVFLSMCLSLHLFVGFLEFLKVS